MTELRTEDLRDQAHAARIQSKAVQKRNPNSILGHIFDFMAGDFEKAADEIDRLRAENEELRGKVTTLNNEDWAAFVASLDNPLPSTEDLRNLMADTDKE